MKIKIFAFAFAVIATAFNYLPTSAAKRLNPLCSWKFNGTVCVGATTDRTNEGVCNLSAAGPLCTVTPVGLGATVTAYPPNNCLLPWRKVNP